MAPDVRSPPGGLSGGLSRMAASYADSLEWDLIVVVMVCLVGPAAVIGMRSKRTCGKVRP